jgi:hypothetical protein
MLTSAADRAAAVLAALPVRDRSGIPAAQLDDIYIHGDCESGGGLRPLALQKANYEGGGKFIGYVAMAKRLTEWRNAWLKT